MQNISEKNLGIFNEGVKSIRKRMRNKKAGIRTHTKTLLILTLSLTIFYFIYRGQNLTWQIIIFIYFSAGLVNASIGVNVMHDAAHRSYSKKNWINELFANSINVLGGSLINWRAKHNVLHHSYTNIKNEDEDIDAARVIRLSWNQPWKKLHKWQTSKIYILLVYSLLMIAWMVADFEKIPRYLKNPKLVNYNSKARAWTNIVFWKIATCLIWIIIPILLGHSVFLILAAFVLMNLACGLKLSLIFQLAHIQPDAKIYGEGAKILSERKKYKDVHVMYTTTNYGVGNPLVTNLTGGLNYQIEHHIFPEIAHEHYPKISKEVEALAIKCGIPYIRATTYSSIQRHISHVQQMGRYEDNPGLAA